MRDDGQKEGENKKGEAKKEGKNGIGFGLLMSPAGGNA